MKKINKKTRRIIGIILGIVILLSAVYFLTMDPRRGVIKRPDPSLSLDHVLTQQEAARDLEYFYNHLKSRHPVWLGGPEQLVQAVEDQYQTEVDQLGEQVTVLELWQASGRIAAELGDGHTWVTWNEPNTPLYIDSFKQLDDYGTPLAINDVPISKIMDNFLSLIPVESQSYAEATFFKNIIISESFLNFSSVDTSDGIFMTFQTGEGEQTFHYVFVPIEKVSKYANSVTDDEWLSYVIDQEDDVGIFTLKSCVFNEEYQETLDSFFSEVFDNSIEQYHCRSAGKWGRELHSGQ